jgi:hypothetical protein
MVRATEAGQMPPPLLLNGGREATMAKKSPTTPPLRKFFGKYARAMEEAQAAEERRLYPNVAALIELIEKGEHEPPRMTTSGAFWEEVEQWSPRVRSETSAVAKSPGHRAGLFVFQELFYRVAVDCWGNVGLPDCNCEQRTFRTLPRCR